MGTFRTKLDFSDNRQVKQRIETITILSGGTSFGVPYGDLPTGPNPSLSSITQSISNILGTFSGNSGTTVFTWTDSRFNLGNSTFSAITPSNSGVTQNSGNVFTPITSSLFSIDGNTGYTQYSGVSFTMYPTTFIGLGGGAYSGQLATYVSEILSATGLDFTGRTIWNDVSGITRTNRLIINDMPVSGYVWTCIDTEGMGEWQYNGSSSGQTLAQVLVNGNSTGNNWIEVDITSSTNGVRSNDSKDRVIEFNPDGIDLYVYGSVLDTQTAIEMTDSQLRILAFSGTGGFPDTEAYIDIYPTGNISLENTGVFDINSDIISINGNIGSFSGAQYTDDFSAQFTDRSLVDKEYVDRFGVWTAGTGINSAVLGGSGGYASYSCVAAGEGVSATTNYSFAEGFFTLASGSRSHAEGSQTTAYGGNSHAEGAQTIASGNTSHAEGYKTLASGYVSHAEGSGTTASGQYSHAEGAGAIASGDTSHAQGKNTIAGGFYSHAEGSGTTAIGSSSHAEGAGTTASGNYSHAGGYEAKILGSYSESSFIHSHISTIDGGEKSSILGGENLSIVLSDYSGIFCGTNNQIGLGEPGFNANAAAAVIIGGTYNIIYENLASSSILGGSYNEIHKYNDNSSIVGGRYNSISGMSENSGIFAGSGNTITSHDNAFIGGGSNNLIDFCLTTIGGNTNESILGGQNNTILTSYNSTIIGGSGNTIDNSLNSKGGGNNVLFGGLNNNVTLGIYSSLIGGQGNSISGDCHSKSSAIIAGSGNTNYGDYSVIIGGRGNYTRGGYISILNSQNSTIEGTSYNSQIIGGDNHSIYTSQNSAIIGGSGNTIPYTPTAYENTVILGGKGITANTSNTVYVPNMIINTGGTQSKLGINTSTPEYVIDANGNNARVLLADNYTGADAPFKGFALSANSTNVPQIAAATNSYLGGYGLSLGMGVLGDNSISTATSELLGTSGDTFLSSSQKTNNLNIINRSGGTGTNHIRMYAGINSVSAASEPDFQIQGNDTLPIGSNRGYIGIKTGNPEYLLDARGHLNNRLLYDPTFAGNSGTLTMSATTGLPTIGVTTNTGVVNQNGGISIGMRAWNDSAWTTYGKQGDSHVYSSKQSNGLVIISSDGVGTDDYIECYVGGDADGSGALAIHMHGLTGPTKGYVGFDTNLPTQRLDVNGNGRFRSIGSSASSGALHYTSDGTLTVNTSDERLKTNITTLTGALDKVNQLRGVTYNWNENPTGDTRIGFIAQEVNAVVPELTFTNPNSPELYMGVHYDNVTALLVEAVKELSSGITTSNNTHLETQTILAEDNNIELNFNGTQQTALGGGLTVLHAKGQDQSANLITDVDGNFVTNNDFKPQALTIPLYTPTSSNDTVGSEGNITRDDNYMYVKTSTGWKRTNLENF